MLVGTQAEIDALLRAIVTSGLSLRALELTEEPLESLFFMLTESAPGSVPADLDRLPAGAPR